MFKDKLISPLFIFIFFSAANVFAETVTLKSGKTIEGNILEKTDQYIKIEFNGTPIYYELKYIKNIDKEEAPLAPDKDANFYLKESLKYGSHARFKEAEEETKKGLRINPADHNLLEVSKMLDELNSGAAKEEYVLYLFQGSDYLMNAQYQSAMAIFKKAQEFNPDNADLNYYLGICGYYLEQYPEAVNNLKKALEKKNDPELYYYLGLSNYSLGQYSEAITYLDKLLEINPNDADAYGVRGVSRYSSGEDEKAMEDLKKARQLFQSQGNYLKAKEIEDFLGRLM